MEFPTLNSYVTWRDERRVEYKMLADMLGKSKAYLSSDKVKQASRAVSAEMKAAQSEGRVPHWRKLRINTALTQQTRISLKAQGDRHPERARGGENNRG
jgi:hypothetical protein